VVGVTTTSPVTVPVFETLDNMPNWTLDYQNGSIAVNFFVNAGIPSTAYGGSDKSGWKTPAQLGYCDDLFVMPHADPTWATHANLLAWNLTYKGGIWLGCHAGSALEDMFNPSDKTQQTNFLSNKTGTATGTDSYCQNALQLWSNHSGGSPPYSYAYPEDPIMQFMGTMDAAEQNGSEQMYMPVLTGSWRAGARLYVYDPTQADVPSKSPGPAATLISGRGFDDPNRGRVMMQAGHNISGTAAANVAAQRAFFNFSFYATEEKAQAAALSINTIPSPLYAGVAQPLSFTFSGIVSNYDILWQSSGGGTFTPNATSQSVTFTPPAVTSPTTCIISLTLTDKICPLKVVSASPSIQIACGLQVATTVTPACFGLSTGSIAMSISGGPAPYVWSWTKSGGGTGNGTGTLISNLATGTYTVNVTAENGTGCGKSFIATINENPQITVSSSKTNLLCNSGASGSINLSVSGGSPAYTYLWTGGATTQNRTGLAADTYNVTITDSKGCTQAAPAITLSQPDAIVITTPTVTSLKCNGNPTGAITLAVNGGTGSYTYAWADGPATQNRANLAAGTYSVTVTDANSCRQTSAGIPVTQPAAFSASASADPITSNGGTTTLTVSKTGGTGPFQYKLNGGDYQAGNTFTVTASSSAYLITVKDANDCIATTTLLVTQPGALSISTVITNVGCPGNSDGKIDMTITGGDAPFAWSWSKSGGGSSSGSGASSPASITGLAAGTYTVTVTASAGAGSSKTFAVTVNANSLLTATATPTHPVCNGALTGSISLSVTGGTPAYEYDWSSGSHDQNLTGLAAGNYSVTVRDNKGCTATVSTTLTQPAVIAITPTVVPVDCKGNSTGEISLAVSGGTGPYTYAWTDGSAINPRTNLSAGTYTVTVTDSKSCTRTQGFAVTQPDAVLSLSATKVDVACNGNSTGSIDLTPEGGTTAYTYNWGSGVATQDRTDLAAGTYSVTVTDARGCKAELSKTITQAAALSLSAKLTHEKCPSGAESQNGAIVLTVTGGSGSYTYSWTGPDGFTSTSKDLSSLKGGTYRVIVTDASVVGCTAPATDIIIKTLNKNPVRPTGIK